MHIKKVSKTLPRPSRDTALELLDHLIAEGGELHDPDVLVEAIVIAYQNGFARGRKSMPKQLPGQPK